MENKNTIYYDQLKDVHESFTKTIVGGRLKGMTDIKPQWRMQRMTEVFGPIGIGWYYKETGREYKEANGLVAVFVNIELFYRYEKTDAQTGVLIGYEWSMPIQGSGGSMFVAKESTGNYVSDEAVKMATTDALSVAMKALGMAANIYMGLPASKYDLTPPPADKDPKKKVVTAAIYENIKERVKSGQFKTAQYEVSHELTAGQIAELKLLEP